jgi:hypothetical protein
MAADPLPVRKPGSWELTTIAPTVGMKTFKTCIAPGDSIASGGTGDCGSPSVKRVGDEVFVNVLCKSSAGTEKISMLVTGDFKTWYRAITKITFDPPQSGLPHMGVTIDGKYVGPDCKGDTSKDRASK